MARTISNTDKIIDSRDVIKRCEELADEREALADELTEAIQALNDFDAEDDDPTALPTLEETAKEAREALEEWDAENGDELKALKDFCEEGESNSSDWQHGETLIHEDYFQEYAQQFADDIGAIDAKAHWPICHIDWEAAAEALKQDYAEIEWDGETYLIRSC